MVYRKSRRGKGRKRTVGKYRNNIANQIQLAIPRPLKTQLVRMSYRNSVYWKPAIIGTTQPTLGFTINVNQPHAIFSNSRYVGSPQETWTSALASGGQVQHLATWAGKYNKYLVRGAKVTITFRTEGNSVTTDRSGKVVMIRHSDDDDVNQYSTWNEIQNTNQYTRVANVSPSTATTNQLRLSMGYSAARSSAIKKSSLTANPDLQGSMEGVPYIGPIDDEYISVAYCSPFQAATTGAYTMPEGLCEVAIEYLVQFLDPKQNTNPQPLDM